MTRFAEKARENRPRTNMTGRQERGQGATFHPAEDLTFRPNFALIDFDSRTLHARVDCRERERERERELKRIKRTRMYVFLSLSLFFLPAILFFFLSSNRCKSKSVTAAANGPSFYLFLMKLGFHDGAASARIIFNHWIFNPRKVGKGWLEIFEIHCITG